MEVKFNTKYKINQTLYFIPRLCLRIEQVTVLAIIYYGHLCYEYMVYGSGERIEEEFLFATKEEAELKVKELLGDKE